MPFNRKQQEIQNLKCSIETLSSKYPLTEELKSIVAKDFNQLRQSGAYEVLRYLINASRENIHFKPLRECVWKSSDSYDKVMIEKFKKNVLQSIKELSAQGKVKIPVLKKSELMVPSCPRFFSCCLAISSYALSHQLSLMGIEFWPESQPGLINVEHLEDLLRNEINISKEESSTFQKEYEDRTIQLKTAIDELNLLKASKEDAFNTLNSLIDCCSFENKDILRDERTRLSGIEEYSRITDELCDKNETTFKELTELNETLKFLVNISNDNNAKGVVIDGKELASSINYTTRSFAEKEGIQLFERENLSIPALFKVVEKSMATLTQRDMSFSKVFDLKLPPCDLELLNRLTKMKEKIEHDIAKTINKLELCVKENELEVWLNDFSTTIPSINFDLYQHSFTKSRKLIADTEKIERLIKIQERKDSKNTKLLASLPSEESNPTDYWKPIFMRRRSRSSTPPLLRDSSLHSTKLNVSPKSIGNSLGKNFTNRFLRKSLWDITFDRQTQHSLSPSMSRVLKDPLSSTPKSIEMTFEDARSISPISRYSLNSSVTLESRESKVQNTSGASTFSTINSSPSIGTLLDTSTLSINRKDSFDCSQDISLPDLSLTSLMSESEGSIIS